MYSDILALLVLLSVGGALLGSIAFVVLRFANIPRIPPLSGWAALVWVGVLLAMGVVVASFLAGTNPLVVTGRESRVTLLLAGLGHLLGAFLIGFIAAGLTGFLPVTKRPNFIRTTLLLTTIAMLFSAMGQLKQTAFCFGGCSESVDLEEPKASATNSEISPEFLSLKQQAEAGDALAQYEIGLRYSEGKGVLKDATQAVSWWRMAAEQGNAPAQRRLGLSYIKREGIPTDDQTENRFSIFLNDQQSGIQWLRKAAEQGDAEAQVILGQGFDGEGLLAKEASLFFSKENLNKDAAPAESVKWYRLAAEQGVADAQVILGKKIFYGKGVPKDPKQAAVWIRKAAEQGHMEGQYRLGWMYVHGLGVTKDDTIAAEWFRKAAEHGYAEAQRWLGAMYGHGYGVPQNIVWAYTWFNLAAAQGNEQAVKNLENISMRMNPEQIAEAKRLSREWKSTQ